MLPAFYKGRLIGESCIDFIVAGLVVVEIKSVDRMNPVFDAELLAYLRMTKNPLVCWSTSIHVW